MRLEETGRHPLTRSAEALPVTLFNLPAVHWVSHCYLPPYTGAFHVECRALFRLETLPTRDSTQSGDSGNYLTGPHLRILPLARK